MATMIRFVMMSMVFSLLSCDVISPDNDRFQAGPILLVSDKDGSSQLWSMNEDGSNVRQLTHDPKHPVFDARWSPDGKKIVYVSYDSPDDYRWRALYLYVMNADGSGRYKLTRHPVPTQDTRPVWSPDGKRIAFSRLGGDISGDTDIFVIDVDGRNERRITRYGYSSEFPAGWFLDGSALLVSYGTFSSDKSQIAKMDLNGNYGLVLSSPEDSDGGPVLSPDEASIAFSSLTVRNGVWGRFLHLMDSDGANRRQLFISLHQHEYPVDWSPDGQRILSMTQDPNSRSVPSVPYSNFPQDILIVSASDGSARKITPFPHREAYSRPTSWRRR